MSRLSKRKQIEIELGNKIIELLSHNQWERISQDTDSYYSFEKKIQQSTIRVDLGLSNQTNYSIDLWQEIIFNDLTAIIEENFSCVIKNIKKDFPSEWGDFNWEVVSIRDTFIKYPNLNIHKNSNLSELANYISELIVCEENNILKDLTNIDYVFQKNSSKLRWQWLSRPYLQYALFMIAYAIKNNKLDIMHNLKHKIDEISQQNMPDPKNSLVIVEILLAEACSKYSPPV